MKEFGIYMLCLALIVGALALVVVALEQGWLGG
jgi:hypothetical protein